MSLQARMHSLTQEIVGSYDARASGIQALRREVSDQRHSTGDWMKETHQSRNSLTQELRAGLEKGHTDLTRAEAQRKKQVDYFIRDTAIARHARAGEMKAQLHKKRDDLATREAKRRTEVNSFCREMASSRQAMARDLRQTLYIYRSALSQGDAQRKASTGAYIHEIAAGHAGARHEWGRMASAMGARRQAKGNPSGVAPQASWRWQRVHPGQPGGGHAQGVRPVP